MTTTITISDESAAGKTLNEFSFEIPTERITVRELIRSRVYQEVKDYNASQADVYRGLVQPTDAEEELNGYRMTKKRMIDWQKQFDKAVSAFEQNQILILVEDQQMADLEEEVELSSQSKISFLRLTPLVGG